MSRADATRICLRGAKSIREEDRAKLSTLLDAYAREVDAAAEQIRVDPPPFSVLIERAQEEFAEEFASNTLEGWRERHPDAKLALERQELILTFIIDDVLEGGEQVLAATRRAGLPASKLAQADDLLQQAFNRLHAFAERIERQQEGLARAPPDSAVYLDGMTILTDAEIQRLQIGDEVCHKLCTLLSPEQCLQLDQELSKLATGR